MAISRAPLHDIERFRRRTGWRFDWVSSYGTDFNYDFGVSFTPEEVAGGKIDYNYGSWSFVGEEWPGVSVFHKNEAGEVFHTYSAYGRGVEVMMGAERHPLQDGMGASPRPVRSRSDREDRIGQRFVLQGARVRRPVMRATHMARVPRLGGVAGSGGGAAPALGRWLYLATAPTFAIMALWTALSEAQPDMLCMAIRGPAAMSGMTPMYLLMSLFHSPPWPQLIAGRRSGARAPYRRCGRFVYEFAGGKIARDPAYAAIFQRGLLQERQRILDLGCGLGLLAATLRAAEHCRSVAR